MCLRSEIFDDIVFLISCVSLGPLVLCDTTDGSLIILTHTILYTIQFLKEKNLVMIYDRRFARSTRNSRFAAIYSK